MGIKKVKQMVNKDTKELLKKIEELLDEYIYENIESNALFLGVQKLINERAD